MAIDFTKPVTTDNYSTVLLPGLIAAHTAIAQLLDSTQTTITGTPPTYVKRYNRTSSALEEWNGSAWVNIPLQGITYASARLGIGTTPVASGANAMDLQIGNPTVATGAGITLGATTTNDIAFADAISGSGQYAGLIRYSHANDSFQIWTASTERWRTTGSGDFGLGTTTPNKLAISRALTVNGSVNSAFELAAGDVSCGWLFGSASRVTLETNGAIPFTVNVNGAEAFRVDTSRFLSLGGTVAYQRLDVTGSIHWSATNGDTGGYLNSMGTNEAAFSGGATYSSYSAPNYIFSARATAASGMRTAAGETIFWGNTGLTIGATFTTADRMRILPSGPVLIARSADSGLGSLQVSDTVGALGDFSSSFVGTALLRVRNTGAQLVGLAIQNSWTGTDGASGLQLLVDSSGGAYVSQRETQPLYLQTDGVTRFGVESTGRVFAVGMHNHASGYAGTTRQFIGSLDGTGLGTSLLVNLSAATGGKYRGVRVGNTFFLTASFSVTVSGAGDTSFRWATPIPHVSGSITDISGTAVADDGNSIAIACRIGMANSTYGFVNWTSPGAGSYVVTVHCSYVVAP